MGEVLGVVHRRVRVRTETMTQKGPFLRHDLGSPTYPNRILKEKQEFPLRHFPITMHNLLS
jgi:hypothetical protein